MRLAVHVILRKTSRGSSHSIGLVFQSGCFSQDSSVFFIPFISTMWQKQSKKSRELQCPSHFWFALDLFEVDHTIATDLGKDGRCHHSGRNLVGRSYTLATSWILFNTWVPNECFCYNLVFNLLSYILYSDYVVSRVIQPEETLRAVSIPTGRQLRSSSIRCRPGQIMHSLILCQNQKKRCQKREARSPTRTNTTISARSSQKALCKVRLPTICRKGVPCATELDWITSGLSPMTQFLKEQTFVPLSCYEWGARTSPMAPQPLLPLPGGGVPTNLAVQSGGGQEPDIGGGLGCNFWFPLQQCNAVHICRDAGVSILQHVAALVLSNSTGCVRFWSSRSAEGPLLLLCGFVWLKKKVERCGDRWVIGDRWSSC